MFSTKSLLVIGNKSEKQQQPLKIDNALQFSYRNVAEHWMLQILNGSKLISTALKNYHNYNIFKGDCWFKGSFSSNDKVSDLCLSSNKRMLIKRQYYLNPDLLIRLRSVASLKL